VREVYACEQEGDKITHAILRRLAEQAQRTHLDAADVHALAVALDDVVDFAEEAADQLGRYGAEAPMEQAEAIGDVLVAAAREVTAALHELRNGIDPPGTSWRSTGSRTRPTRSSAARSPSSSHMGSTR